MDRKEHIKNVKRIVVKVGTAVITRDGLEHDLGRIRRIVSQIVELKTRGYELVLVSSGAIGIGAHALGFKSRPQRLSAKQAAAAVGQGRLVHVYEKMFRKHGVLTAQILLTRADIEDRTRYVNAKNTLDELIRMRVIPIVNENDTVAVDEIEFGDNDTLAAFCTNLIHAEMLIILSDIKSLMTGDPRQKGAQHTSIPVVTKIDRDIEMIAEGAKAYKGVGGIKTKLDAAKIVVVSGETMVLADGKKKDVLIKIMEGLSVGTIFYPSGRKMQHKKRWLAFLKNVRGKVVIDAGASRALRDSQGKSLLASGVVEVLKDFQRGDVIEVSDVDGKAVGRGRTNFSSHEIRLIRGKKSCEIKSMFGAKAAGEVIHRDEMVIF